MCNTIFFKRFMQGFHLWLSNTQMFFFYIYTVFHKILITSHFSVYIKVFLASVIAVVK